MSVQVTREIDEIPTDEHEYLYQGHAQNLQTGWLKFASCRDAEPDLFFPVSVGDTSRRAIALSFCSSCLVRPECLSIALADRSLVGIWGGTDEADRATIRAGEAANQAAHREASWNANRASFAL
jgi:WhiB family redox-sensing transcriptional regulator